MIPKIIHYSWFSGEPFPDFIKEYMRLWRVYLPDYEFILWDGAKLLSLDNTFANEAISVRKWAFAADYLRLQAVYDYGGIWLDTDIELFDCFDRFLGEEMFIGREYYTNSVEGEDVALLTSHCFGARRHHPFIGECLEYYTQRHFIRSRGKNLPEPLRYDMTTIPMVQASIARNYGYDWRTRVNTTQRLTNGVTIYPYQYFDQPGYNDMSDVVCIHRVAQSWNPRYPNRIPHRCQTNPKSKGFKYFARQIARPVAKLLNKI